MSELDEMVGSAIKAAMATSPEFNHGWRSMPDKELIHEILDEIPVEYTKKDIAEAIYRYKMRRLLGQAAPQPVWQPMDTAPKDGTVILLYGGAYSGFPFSGRWDLGPFGETDRPWLNVINMSRLYAHVPYGWMDIPASDAAATGAVLDAGNSA